MTSTSPPDVTRADVYALLQNTLRTSIINATQPQQETSVSAEKHYQRASGVYNGSESWSRSTGYTASLFVLHDQKPPHGLA